MADKLDNLLDRVEDPTLRTGLNQQIEELRQKRGFGLVFKKHLPETVRLPSHPVRRGLKVSYQDDPSSMVWEVAKVYRGKATIVGPDGQTEIVATTDLVVVAEFGEPIFPGLKHTGSVHRGGDKPSHVVINGENYHALDALLFAYEEKVDCIYIDPPYNKGTTDWKYNNNYVYADDGYRHSKWLAFMERRLRLAKRLLNPDNSVLIVTVDEREVHRLGVLLHQIFPRVKIQMISSVISPGGVSREREFTRVNEFIFYVMIGTAAPAKTTNDLLFTAHRSEEANRSTIWRGLLRGGSGPLREDSSTKFFPILINAKRKMIVGVGDALPLEQDRDTYKPPRGTVAVWPIKSEGVEGRWELSRPTFDERLAKGYVRLGRYNEATDQWTINYLRNAEIERLASGELITTGMTPQGYLNIAYAPDRNRSLFAKSVWNEPSHDAGTHGKSMLKALIPTRKFDYPKSLYAVEDCLRFFVKDKKDSLIVDFFAGSGTTAHAVMRLNRQDGGTRRSIMVTNNEVSADEAADLREKGYRPGSPTWENLGICRHITVPRITAAMTGLTPTKRAIPDMYRAYKTNIVKCPCNDPECQGTIARTDFVDDYPMSEGFEENAEFFDLTYQDPERINIDVAFDAIAPMLWLQSGATGPILERTETYSISDSYGVLFDTDSWRKFVSDVHARVSPEDTKKFTAYIITEADAVFTSIAKELGGVNVERLYKNYLTPFMINQEQPEVG